MSDEKNEAETELNDEDLDEASGAGMQNIKVVSWRVAPEEHSRTVNVSSDAFSLNSKYPENMPHETTEVPDTLVRKRPGRKMPSDF